MKYFLRSLCSVTLINLLVASIQAGDVVKENNTAPLNSGASWALGVVPSDADTAVWDNTVSADNAAVSIGAALTWDGLRIVDPGAAIVIGGTDRLTLDGGAATDMDMSLASQDLTLNTPLALSGTQVLDVSAGHALTLNGLTTVGSGSLTKNGAGVVLLSGTVTNAVSCIYAAGETVYAGATLMSGLTSL